MSCTRPVIGYQLADGSFSLRRRGEVVAELELPCGVCPPCLVRRSSDLSLRLCHEAQLHDESAVATLTYAPEHVPALGSLCKRDVQLFMKRLRFELAKRGVCVRHHCLGEYSPVPVLRPHYHVILFGWWPDDARPWARSRAGRQEYVSELVSGLWGRGHVTLQRWSPGAAAYIAGHQGSKLRGRYGRKVLEVWSPDGGELLGFRAPEFQVASNRPGIGAGWFARYSGDVVAGDCVVLRGGVKVAVPRYYDRLRKRCDPQGLEDAKLDRQVKGRARAAAVVASHGSREAYLAAHEAVVVARERFESASRSGRAGAERER